MPYPNSKVETSLRTIAGELGITFPSDVIDFVAQLDDAVTRLGSDEWRFLIAESESESAGEALIAARRFRKEWGLDGFVLAENGLGDSLILLPREDADSASPRALGSSVYVVMHEVGEIRNFASSPAELDSCRDIYATDSDDCVYRLTDDDSVEKGPAYGRAPGEALEPAPSAVDSKWELDGWIDDRRSDRAEELLAGLSALTRDEAHAAWAHHKLSDLYRNGFGSIPEDLDQALLHNAEAARLGHAPALANRAYLHLMGIGVERDLDLAEKLVREANAKSRRMGLGDLHDDLVAAIEETRKQG